MLLELRVKNCFSFAYEITFSMAADMRNKKFISNVYRVNNFNVLKTAGIYGSNNSGKTCLVKCIRGIKNILLNHKPEILSNIFLDNTICELGISFLVEGKAFSYDFCYDTKKKEFPYEKFIELKKDQYGNEKEEIWLLKDSIHSCYQFQDEELMKILPMISQSNLLFYLIDTAKFKVLAEMKKITTLFADTIDIINMNNIPLERTINLMKNKNDLQKKVVEFIKNSDLYMDDFKYINDITFHDSSNEEKPEEKALDLPEQNMDQIRLVSVYKGVPVPSLLFDSTGTKKS